MRFHPMGRRSHTPATLTRSKRPARTRRFLQCRLTWNRFPADYLQILGLEALATRFPPVRALTRRRYIPLTENISPGVRKRALASKPINGGSYCKIDNREKRAI